VLHDGALLGWLGRGKHPLITFLPEEPPARDEAARVLAFALAGLVDGGRKRALVLWTIDGVDAAQSDLSAVFVAAGFVRTGGRRLIKRADRPKARDEDDEWPLASPDA
jgi:hypothetical protein